MARATEREADFLRRLQSLVNQEDVFGYSIEDKPDAELEWNGFSDTATLVFDDGVRLVIWVDTADTREPRT